jgi:hypothetical protein
MALIRSGAVSRATQSDTAIDQKGALHENRFLRIIIDHDFTVRL